jgi:hypothetical protein
LSSASTAAERDISPEIAPVVLPHLTQRESNARPPALKDLRDLLPMRASTVERPDTSPEIVRNLSETDLEGKSENLGSLVGNPGNAEETVLLAREEKEVLFATTAKRADISPETAMLVRTNSLRKACRVLQLQKGGTHRQSLP